MGIIFVLSIVGLIVGVVVAAFGIMIACADDGVVCLIIGILIVGFSVFGLCYTLGNEPDNAVRNASVKTDYGRVVSVESNYIEFQDGSSFKVNDDQNAVTMKYHVSFDGLKIGDIIEYKYLDSYSYNYLISVSKIKDGN